jgi:hypothetical protein
VKGNQNATRQWRIRAALGAGVAALSFFLVFGLQGKASAMDRWAALSQIESGDNDLAIGAGGEVSRYQMKPELWRRYAPANADWKKPEDALAVAQQMMKERCAGFERLFHRQPTDFEFYVLWNAPASIEQPPKVVSERADRFCNLVQRVAAR